MRGGVGRQYGLERRHRTTDSVDVSSRDAALEPARGPSVEAVLLMATTSSVLSLAWLCTLALGLVALDRLGCRGTESLRITQIQYFD